MTFKLGGTTLTQQPTTHKWVNSDPVGIDGNAHAMYPAFREYEIEWDFLSAAQFNEIKNYFTSIGNTGSIVASLPQYGASTYTFFDYTGCVLREPQYDSYFEQYYQGVKLLIVRIRT